MIKEVTEASLKWSGEFQKEMFAQLNAVYTRIDGVIAILEKITDQTVFHHELFKEHINATATIAEALDKASAKITKLEARIAELEKNGQPGARGE